MVGAGDPPANTICTPTKSVAGKKQLLSRGADIFKTAAHSEQQEQQAQEAQLYEQIGRLKMALEWLKKICPL